jgi:hypothetical protein
VLVLPAMEANTNKVIVIRSYASSPFVSTSDRRPASAAPTALARAMQTLQNFGLVFRESRNGWWSLVTAALLEATQGFEGGPSSSAGGIRAVDAGADEVHRVALAVGRRHALRNGRRDGLACRADNSGQSESLLPLSKPALAAPPYCRYAGGVERE